MGDATYIMVRVPMTIRRRPGRKTVLTPVAEGGTSAVPTRADPALVRALARAFWYQRLLDRGAVRLDQRDGGGGADERGYLGSLLRLMLLAPDIVEMGLARRLAQELTFLRLLKLTS